MLHNTFNVTTAPCNRMETFIFQFKFTWLLLFLALWSTNLLHKIHHLNNKAVQRPTKQPRRQSKNVALYVSANHIFVQISTYHIIYSTRVRQYSQPILYVWVDFCVKRGRHSCGVTAKWHGCQGRDHCYRQHFSVCKRETPTCFARDVVTFFRCIYRQLTCKLFDEKLGHFLASFIS